MFSAMVAISVACVEREAESDDSCAVPAVLVRGGGRGVGEEVTLVHVVDGGAVRSIEGREGSTPSPSLAEDDSGCVLFSGGGDCILVNTGNLGLLVDECTALDSGRGTDDDCAGCRGADCD